MGYDGAVQAVIFDLDGTLLDTYELIRASFRHASRTVLHRELPDEVLMAKVGQPLAVQMRDFTSDPEEHDELLRVYREHNAAHHDGEVRLFPGTLPMLDALRAAGLRLGIVTSKRHGLAARGVELFGLTDRFEFLIGSDDWPEHKPSPGPVLRGCELLGLAPQACLYVGDSPYDMQAGNAAGCRTAAALWGMFPRASLEAEHPTYICADGTDVPRVLGVVADA